MRSRVQRRSWTAELSTPEGSVMSMVKVMAREADAGGGIGKAGGGGERRGLSYTRSVCVVSGLHGGCGGLGGGSGGLGGEEARGGAGGPMSQICRLVRRGVLAGAKLATITPVLVSTAVVVLLQMMHAVWVNLVVTPWACWMLWNVSWMAKMPLSLLLERNEEA